MVLIRVSVVSKVVLSPPGCSRPSDAFDDLSRLVADDLAQVNRTILDRMHSPVALIPQLAGHLIASGGKRLRPMLTLATARLCGAAGNRQVKLAACVEFIHTATLLHDDVVDESDLRRGRASANAVWGNQASVLVGDFLFARAFELMVEDGAIPVLAVLANAASVIAEGEVLQLTTANDTETGEDAYLKVIESKTARLFAAACEVGALVADSPEGRVRALSAYGRNLGIAFQLIDDVLDYSADQARLGKTVGNDFREGKITLPVILAFRAGDEGERAFWRRTLENLEQTDDGTDLGRAQDLLARYGALAATVARAREYGERARAELAGFPDSPMRRALSEIVDFCVERAF